MIQPVGGTLVIDDGRTGFRICIRGKAIVGPGNASPEWTLILSENRNCRIRATPEQASATWCLYG